MIAELPEIVGDAKLDDPSDVAWRQKPNLADSSFETADTMEGVVSDPISLNLYLYANADPVNLCDPSGHDATDDDDGLSGLWDTTALAPIAAGVSVLEGVEGGYANAATDVSSYVGGLAAGFAGSFATSMLSFEGYASDVANSAGDALTGFYNQYVTKIQGGYGFVGLGLNSPIGGIEGGIGVAIGKDGIGVGFEGYAYAGEPGLPFAGYGGWAYPGGGHGSGSLIGGSFGPISIERFYDKTNDQTYYGASGGEGIVWGFGFYMNGND